MSLVRLRRELAKVAVFVLLPAGVWAFNAGCSSDAQTAPMAAPDGGAGDATTERREGAVDPAGACGPEPCPPGMFSRVDLRCVDRDSGVSGPCTANSVLVDAGRRCFVRCGQPGDGAGCPPCAPNCETVFGNFISPGPDQPGFCSTNEVLCIPADHLKTCLP